MEEEKEQKYELIIVDNKNEIKNKILVFFTLTVVVIITSSIAGAIITNSRKKEQEEEENIEILEENIVPTPIIPIYSEEAKNRIDNIYVSNDEEKVAYLTFDDGPSSNITPQILEILKKEDVKATFFVLGSRVELYPELVKQEYEEGHYIANHGYSHVYQHIYSSVSTVLDEYNLTELKIKEALGINEYSSHLFRFPGGSEGGKYKKIKNEAKDVLAQNNISYVNWNCLTNDSVGKPTKQSLVDDLKLTASRKK